MALPLFAFAQVTTTPAEVEAAIVANLSRVPEFVFIRAEAEKLGVKAYLFGGTAAGYAHYVRNDLQRVKGDTSIQASRFDYDFTSIFRSTQDLDVVIDGSMEKIEQLRQVLVAKYPHFIGAKAAKWELRSLREAKGKPGEQGYKEPLLDSPDFLKQNSDSNSTGLIEITKVQPGTDAVIDLRDRQGRPSQFLRDVAAGEITFYVSAEHKSSPRAAAGLNPEIFSVVRALTKAFQYDLKFKPADWARMQSIAWNFNPKDVFDHPENRRRLIDMGKKLFMHAVDVERAWNDLETLGLRQKLTGFDNEQAKETMAWWMNKEPLRSKPVGQGAGKTAAEIARGLGMDRLVVAHETRSFLALESIERSTRGSPNFFISRKNHPGEAAAYAEGTYTQIGRKGAVGSGLTIRLVLDPQAREGTDFEFGGPQKQFVILTNKAAATVINESFSLTPSQYVEMIANDESFDLNEKGLIEKMTRRLTNQAKNISSEEMAKIRSIYQSAQKKDRILAELLRIGLPLPISSGELDARISRLVNDVDAAKDEYRKAMRSRWANKGIEERAVELSERLAGLATKFDHIEAAFTRGFTPARDQASMSMTYWNALQRVMDAHLDRAIALAIKEDRAYELRELLVGTQLSGRFKETMLKHITKFSELESLMTKIPGEMFGGRIDLWIVANPDLVMRMDPTPEQLEKARDIVPEHDRAEWARGALPYANKPSEFLTLLEPRDTLRFEAMPSDYELSRLWVPYAKRFAELKPTDREVQLALAQTHSRQEQEAIKEAVRAAGGNPERAKSHVEVQHQRGHEPVLTCKDAFSRSSRM